MWRRFVYTLLGALAGYLLGAVVGMTVFTAVNGYRSISVLEENNRNRWTFIAASAAAVLGGLLAWWRSYTDIPGSEDVDTTDDDVVTDRRGDHDLEHDAPH